MTQQHCFLTNADASTTDQVAVVGPHLGPVQRLAAQLQVLRWIVAGSVERPRRRVGPRAFLTPSSMRHGGLSATKFGVALFDLHPQLPRDAGMCCPYLPSGSCQSRGPTQCRRYIMLQTWAATSHTCLSCLSSPCQTHTSTQRRSMKRRCMCSNFSNADQDIGSPLLPPAPAPSLVHHGRAAWVLFCTQQMQRFASPAHRYCCHCAGPCCIHGRKRLHHLHHHQAGYRRRPQQPRYPPAGRN